MKHHRYAKPTYGPYQANFATQRPIRSSVDVNEVRRGGRGRALHQNVARVTVGGPFRPQPARGMRGKQFGFPALGREFSEGVHDGRHAPWCVARANVQHLAHGRATPLGVMKPPENARGWALRGRRTQGGGEAGVGMVVVPAMVEGTALAVALLPFLRHRWDMYRWDRDHRHQHGPASTDHSEPLTVMLPVWNEALVIERKLANLADQGVEARLVLIDSASTDATVRLAKAWLAQHPTAFSEHEVIEMPARKGKTAAVVQALTAIGQRSEGLVCMTDADALLERGVLRRLMQWFADPMVGAVGALPRRELARAEEIRHREAWEAMRLAESMVDSTPFLEGSCMMWRTTSLAVDDLYVHANADDAQIATSVRRQGWRSVVDPQARFVDVAPEAASEQRRQKTRRAQGLQRLLLRERRRAGHRNQGVFGRIVRRQFHFHIVAPLALTVAAMSAALRWGFVGLYGWPATFTLANSMHLGLAGLEAVCVVLWWRSRRGLSSGPLSLIGQWLASMELLGRALITTARGRSLHMWEQHQDVRERMSDVEV
jgi:glycosyltransferase involved in cell wall biosynthesis